MLQAANLWKVKESVWQGLSDSIRHNPAFALVDRSPFQFVSSLGPTGVGASGQSLLSARTVLSRQTFYGFRSHVHLNWLGVITRFSTV